ncbi:MAG: CvpA family protein [Clostridiales bacterium]|nr:CvpA family protein [Clostridiales bacterium]
MNTLDILVIGIMTLCITIGAWRGFVRTVLGFANFLIAIFLTNLLYPHMGRFLRGIDGFFDALSAAIRDSMGLDAAIYDAAVDAGGRVAEAEFLQNLPLPAFFRDALIENNNAIIRAAIGAFDFADYVAGFLAGIVINIISMVLVFVLVFFGLMLLTRVLNILTKLPVLNTLNKVLGGAIGAAWGILLTWLVLGVVVVYLSANSAVDVAQMLEASVIAGPLNERNFALDLILRLFP